MTRKQKRLQKIRNNPKGVSFADLQKVLEDYGFMLARITGSHHIFKTTIKGETVTITIPSHGKVVKPVYVREALSHIDEIEALGEDED